MQSKLLAIYLNDHLAGASAGAAVAQRAAGSNRDNDTYYPTLSTVAEEIREDRASLLAIMNALKVGTDPVKQALAWTVEKARRLKLNGHLFNYSPLSRLDELEFLVLGVTGKLALWHSLNLLAPEEPRLRREQLTDLVARAERQLEEIEMCRRRAASDAFSGEPGSSPSG
jgi:hypothetical protein